MILSDKDILEEFSLNGFLNIKIDPFNEKYLQPASYDLHLGNSFIKFSESLEEIDLKKPLKEEDFVSWKVEDDECVTIKPNEFILGVTKEIIGVSSFYAARMDGKSSLGRVGLFVHITAGFIDPGNSLNLTLEMLNVSGVPIVIYPGMPIAQVSFHKLQTSSIREYGDKKLNSKYYGAKTPQISQFYKNFNN